MTEMFVGTNEMNREQQFQHYRNFISHFNDANLTFLEKKTVNQASNELWNKHRIGRITASRMDSALHAKNPCSKTLICDIMGYKKVGRMVPSIRYGQDNEINARNKYLALFADHHKNLAIIPQGLHVDRKYPFLGASPDGLITCDCHPKKIMEIKCPYSYREGLKNWQQDKNFPLDENHKIKKNHQVYTQIQGQLAICNMDTCDLFINQSINQSSEFI